MDFLSIIHILHTYIKKQEDRRYKNMITIQLKTPPTLKVIGEYTSSEEIEIVRYLEILNIVAVDEDRNIIKNFDPIISEEMPKEEFEKSNRMEYILQKLRESAKEIEATVSDVVVVDLDSYYCAGCPFYQKYTIFIEEEPSCFVGSCCKHEKSEDAVAKVLDNPAYIPHEYEPISMN